ncbi:MAG: hypothetical protein JETT_3946 [Candidatus Jettenia ecosi]|uniref:Uncharacterized protein n=1 Tax=Candidatus Jettenia ecosi TaxID=2494326 RepID=A0A533Q5H5_9BACT|nr:MAG: hypothetical protein JETT_3946 [Candidatus Jettenia ecosi]
MRRLPESPQEKPSERKEKGMPGSDSFEMLATRRLDHLR